MLKNSPQKFGVTKLVMSVGCLCIPAFLLILVLGFSPSARFLFYSTSTFDGFFPAGEYHFKIMNGVNEPIQGASLKVFEEGTLQPAFRYPIDNYLSEDDLTSDGAGLIIAIHRPRGFEFGGSCTHFLVVFTKCDKTPRYEFTITADGYQTIRFSDEVIYDLDHTQDVVGTTIVVLENGQEEEIPVFEIGYVLK